MNLLLDNPNNRVLANDDQTIRRNLKRAFKHYDKAGYMNIETETSSQSLKLAGNRLPDSNILGSLLLKEEFAPELKPCANSAAIESSNRKSPSTTEFRSFGETQAIRDKEEALRQLRISEAKYRSLVEQLPVITYLASLETPVKLLYLSPRIQQLGYSAEDFLADPLGLLKRVHADDQNLVKAAYARTYAHHVPLHCEYRLIKSNGEISWILDEASVVIDEAGGSLFLQGVLVDITRDREIEQELFYYRQRLKELVNQRTAQLETQSEILKSANANLDRRLIELMQANSVLSASEKYFRSLVESTDAGIVGVDAEGRCTFINKAAEAMLGYAKEELSGQNLHKMISIGQNDGSLIPTEDWPVYKTFREGVPPNSIELFQRMDRQLFPVEYTSCPMKLDGDAPGTVLVFRDATKSQALIRTLAHQATHDPLTELINRTEFDRRLDRVLSSAKSDQSEHVLCYLDLDHFKNINDSCGHSAGDELLRNLSSMLSAKLRQRDTFARLGGDEFAILFEHLQLDPALDIVNELCESVRRFHFIWQGETFSVSVSIGLKVISQADRDAAIVLEQADAACYQAKKHGRNQVRVFKSRDAGYVCDQEEKSLC